MSWTTQMSGARARRTWRVAAVAAVAAAALALAACSAPTTGGGEDGGATDVGVTADTIQLGATQSLSGPGAASCAPSTDAAALWFNKVNQAGGVQDRQIKFQVLDDGYDPARAIANVRTFQNSAFALVGACGSATAAAIYKPLSEAGVPFLFPTNGVAEVVKPASPGIFQILPLYEDQASTLLRYAFEDQGKGSVFTVVNPLGAYQSVIDNSKATAEEGGGTFINSAVAQLGTPDYTPIALQIKEANPDYVVMSLGGSDTGKFIATLVAQDALPKKLILGTSASVAGSFINSYDTAAADKIRLGSAVLLPLDPNNECGQLLSGSTLANDPIAIIGCGEAQAITHAMSQTTPLTREGISATIESWTEEDAAPGVFAPLTFSATDHLGLASLYIVQPKERAFTTIAQCPYGDEKAIDEPCTAVK